jgi:hypothetical protein
VAFDPIVAATARVADHREPAFVHEEDRRAATARRAEHRARHGAYLESFQTGIRQHLTTCRDYPAKRVVSGG